MTEAIWIVARASGAASLVALTLAMLTGMALRGGVFGWLANNRAIRTIHDFTTLLWLPLAFAHVLALLLDSYARLGLLDVFVPFLVPYARLEIGLGTISLELVLVVVVSTAFRRRMSYEWWLALHWLSYPAFLAAFAHTILAGTDFARTPLTVIAWIGFAALCAAGIRRLAAGARAGARGLERLRAA